MAKYRSGTKNIISNLISSLVYHYPTCSAQNAAVTVILHLFLWSESHFCSWVVQSEIKGSPFLPKSISLGSYLKKEKKKYLNRKEVHFHPNCLQQHNCNTILCLYQLFRILWVKILIEIILYLGISVVT